MRPQARPAVQLATSSLPAGPQERLAEGRTQRGACTPGGLGGTATPSRPRAPSAWAPSAGTGSRSRCSWRGRGGRKQHRGRGTSAAGRPEKEETASPESGPACEARLVQGADGKRPQAAPATCQTPVPRWLSPVWLSDDTRPHPGFPPPPPCPLGAPAPRTCRGATGQPRGWRCCGAEPLLLPLCLRTRCRQPLRGQVWGGGAWVSGRTRVPRGCSPRAQPRPQQVGNGFLSSKLHVDAAWTLSSRWRAGASALGRGRAGSGLGPRVRGPCSPWRLTRPPAPWPGVEMLAGHTAWG